MSQLKLEHSGYSCGCSLPLFEQVGESGFLSWLQEWHLEDAKDPFVFRGGRPRKEQLAGFSASRSLTRQASQVLAEQRASRLLVHHRSLDARML